MKDVDVLRANVRLVAQMRQSYHVYDPFDELVGLMPDVTRDRISSGTLGLGAPAQLSAPDVAVLAILSARIFFEYKGKVWSVAELVTNFKWVWLHTSNVGIFRHHYPTVVQVIGQNSGIVLVPKVEPRPKEGWVYEVFGPRPEDIRMEPCPLREEKPSHTLIYCSIDIYLYPGQVDYDTSHAMMKVRVAQTLWEANWSHDKYHVADYYKRSMYSYSTWSYELHQRQLESLKTIVPKDAVIAAPGDGMGVVLRTFADWCVVSGDANSLVRDVTKETFSETLHRAQGLALRRSQPLVCIFSYISAFFSQHDWDVASSLECSIFVLDSHLVVREGLGTCQVLGDGLVSYRWNAGEWFQLRKEYISYEKRVRYSENLLSLDDYYVDTVSEALMYRVQMMPTLVIRCGTLSVFEALSSLGVPAEMSSKGVKLVDNIRDYVMTGEGTAYVASLGHIVYSSVEADTLKLRSRVLYYVADSALWHARLKFIDHHVIDGRIYFSWAADTDVKLTYTFISQNCQEKGQIEFGRTVREVREFPVFTDDGSRYLFANSRGLVCLPKNRESLFVLSLMIPENQRYRFKGVVQAMISDLALVGEMVADAFLEQWIAGSNDVFSYCSLAVRSEGLVLLGSRYVSLALLRAKGFVRSRLLLRVEYNYWTCISGMPYVGSEISFG